MRTPIGLLIFFLILPFALSQSQSKFALIGASGIARIDDELLFVCDKDPGAFYRFPLAGQKGPRIRIDPAHLKRNAVPEASMALDLEGITLLGDRRIALLSEGLAATVVGPKILTEYPGPFHEFGGVGLEGVAARKLENGGSRIAVIWEGGYGQEEKFPLQLRARVGEVALRPVLLMHNVPDGSTTGRLTNGDLSVHELRVPRPMGKEPFAQRFRVPDIVWYQFNQAGTPVWSIIALLSSQNATRRPQYLHLWLQRYDMKGRPIGDHIDLKKILPPDLRGMNWEGMGWFEEGKSLVLTYDNDPTQNVEAFVVEIPDSWK